MDERDHGIRNHVYQRFVETQAAPRVEDLANELGLSPNEAEAALRRLHDEHALVLEPDRPAIRMLNPFCSRRAGGGRTSSSTEAR
jgi:predicted ArsR family transcriptional regulator